MTDLEALTAVTAALKEHTDRIEELTSLVGRHQERIEYLEDRVRDLQWGSDD